MLSEIRTAISENRAVQAGALVTVLVASIIAGVALQPGQKVYLQTFDGMPAMPLPFRPASGFDVVVHVNDDTFVPMSASHGLDCAGPPATHQTSNFDDSVFLCRDHVMTAIQAGYGVIYLTPAAMVDFSGGEAVIQFDMSTFANNGRDWPDLWVTPYADVLSLPLDFALPDLSGEPRNALHIKFLNRTPEGFVIHDYVTDPSIGRDSGDWKWWVPWSDFLTPSPAIRTTFELRISRTHLKVSMLGLNLKDAANASQVTSFTWYDGPVSLPWGQGIVQWGHHSYNPFKDCQPGDVCGPDTWHFDNFSIAPAVPFTIIESDRRLANAAATTLTFSAPSPAGAALRFSARGTIQFSTDGGASWTIAALRRGAHPSGPETFVSYWTPIPSGVTTVMFRGIDGACSPCPWAVRDASFFSLVAPAPTPAPVPTATPTPIPPPSVTPTLVPTPVPTSVPTPTPEPLATCAATWNGLPAGTPKVTTQANCGLR